MQRKVNNGTVYLAVAKSVKQGDNRVAIPPNFVQPLLLNQWNQKRDKVKLEIMVESEAGDKIGYTDKQYENVGARIVDFGEIQERAHILLDVKQREGDHVLKDGINFFYAHVEKGQGNNQLDALLAAGKSTCYSPETIWVPDADGDLVRGCNLGLVSGWGGVHIGLYSLSMVAKLLGKDKVPFNFFPDLSTTNQDEVNEAYTKIGELENDQRIAIIGSPRGLVASGTAEELEKAGLSYEWIGRDITGDSDVLEEVISLYDLVINTSRWDPGDPRIIKSQHISAMKDGAVFVDNSCDEDGSSLPFAADGKRPLNAGETPTEGSPIKGGVRYSFESKWGDKNMWYWVGPNNHTFSSDEPTQRSNGTHVLYTVNGMIPGGKSTAMEASFRYASQILPYLGAIIRAVQSGNDLPKAGMVIDSGKISEPDLRKLVKADSRLEKYRAHL